MSDTQNPTGITPNKDTVEVKPSQHSNANTSNTLEIPKTNATPAAAGTGANTVKTSVSNGAQNSAQAQTTHATTNVSGTGAPAHQYQGIAFKSAAIGSRENARNKDYFAEQNKKAQEKKQKQSVQTRKALIIGSGVAGVLIVAGLIWLVVALVAKPKEVAQGEVEKTIEEQTFEEAVEAAGLNDIDVMASDNIEREDMEAADRVYAQAIEEAMASENELLTNRLILSQMEFYFKKAERPEDVLALSKEVNTKLLTDEELARYYNYIADAYSLMEDSDEADYYYDLIFELSGGEEYGD